MRLVVFGPQGSGKGTQAASLAQRRGLIYIATGNIFRHHIKHQTELGKLVEPYVIPGRLVPDEVTNEVVRHRLAEPDCQAGFVLDGFPRDAAQYDFLSALTKLDAALYIKLTDEWAVERLSNRLVCVCGASYNTLTNPPIVPGVCDRCGQTIFHRPDDEPAAIYKRLELYHQQTEPLLQRYAEHGILITIDGQQPIEAVSAAIDAALATMAVRVPQA